MSKQYYLMIEGKRVEVTEEVYRAYKQPLWREARNRRNRFRCRDGKGNRCTRNCLECERYLTGIGAQGFDLSIDDMRVDEMEDRNLIVDELDEILELDRARKIRVAINEMDDSSKRIIIMLTEGCKTREECLAKAEEFLTGQAKLAQGLDINATIVDILKRKYEYDYKKNYLSEAGYGRNLDSLKILEKSPLGNVPIRTIERRHIDAYSTKITHYANSTIEKIYLMLRVAFDIAMDEGIITNNIMQSTTMRRPKSKKADKKVRALTPEEQKVFEDALANRNPPMGRNDYRLQLFIALYSGMRMGEINALRLDSIDFENNVVHVNATVSRGVGANWFIKDGTKTEAGVRDVPISEKLKPYLEEALKKYKKNKQKLLFYDCVSKRVITTTQVNSYYKRVCSSVGIESSGQHALRHTFATRCIEAGIPAVVLKTWLGHKDIHMTLDTYTDVFQAMDNDAISKYDEHLNSM